jgi:hypothetical protein
MGCAKQLDNEAVCFKDDALSYSRVRNTTKGGYQLRNVCPSFRTELLGYDRMDIQETLYLDIFLQFV